MNEFNDIDQLFREHARKHELNAPVGSWEQIADSLYHRRKRKTLIWFSAAAVTGLLLFSMALLTYNTNSSQAPVYVQRPEQPVTLPDSLESPHETTGEKAERIPHNSFAFTSTIRQQKLTGPKKMYARIREAVDAEVAVKEETVSKEMQPFATTEIKVKQEEIPLLTQLAEIPEASIPDTVLHTPAPPVLIPPPLEQPTVAAAKPHRGNLWFDVMGGQAFSDYTGRTTADDINTQIYSGEEYHLRAAAFRVEMSMSIAPALSIGAGVHKGSFGNISGLRINDQDMKFVRIQNFGMSSAGKVTASEIDKLVHYSGIQEVEQISVFEKMKVEYSFLDFPLSLRWSLLQHSRAKLIASTGMNLTMVQENTVSLLKGDEWYEIGEIEALRRFLYGAHAGLGLYYPLDKQDIFMFGLSGGMRYYFSSVNPEDEVEYQPYSLEMLIGLKYRILGR